MSWNDWYTFKEGQARFAGGIRGWDELGHETFAVRLDGYEYFGEVKKAWLPNQQDLNTEILSFGYGDQGDVGMSMPCLSSRAFSRSDLNRVMSLAVQLVEAVAQSSERKAFVMQGGGNSRFMGKVLFREGWALLSEAGSERAP
nr:hypothetical protein [Dyella sp. ASV24]